MAGTSFKLLFGISVNPPLKSVIDYSVPENKEHSVDKKHKKVNKKVSKSHTAKMLKSVLVPSDDVNISTIRINSSDFALFQVEAITSVRVLEDGSIYPNDWKFINSNGAAFTFDSIRKYYKTFIGRMVYTEHNQVPELSSGFIIDAQIATKVDEETSFTTASVQLLIAIHRDSEAYRVLQSSGSLSYGAYSSSSTCTICGNESFSDDDMCTHQAYLSEIGKYNLPIGTPVAELVTGEIDFIEISAVGSPAYEGAVVHQYLDVPDNSLIEFQVPTECLSIPIDDHGGIAFWVESGLLDLVS